ncbi:MAG: serine/threonine protein kinase [Deltaproteobacteria bacterium]|nr:serine/threonine protein kinase [Deltaproteobacteria bacterium]
MRRIAIGGMAEVFEAQREGDPTSVVLKVLLPELAADAEFVQMFADEGRLAAALAHPHIVRVHASGEIEGTHYLEMELVDGVSLAELLRGQGAPLEPGLALLVAEGLLAALGHLHGLKGADGRSLGVVHRDLNPRNVLLSRRGEVKLSDFGIARSRLRQGRTRTGVIKGTVQYLAPEQLAGDEVDARTDVYGAGLVLFELLTGAPYIAGEREVDLLRAAEHPRWRAPSSLRPELSPRFDALLQPALQPFPEQRYGSAASFSAALARVREELALRTDVESLASCVRAAATAAPKGVGASVRPIAAGRDGTVVRDRGASALSPEADNQSRETARRRLLGAGALLLAALGVGAYWWVRSTSRERPAGGAAGVVGGAPGDGGRASRPAALDGGSRDRTRSASVAPDASARGVVRRRRGGGAGRGDGGRPGVRGSLQGDGGASVATSPVESTRVAERLRTLRTALGSQGLLLEDLPAELRGQWVAAEGHLREGRLVAARESLTSLERRLASVRVDRPLVQEKLNRVDRLLRALPATRPDRRALEDQAATALQTFMDGDYAGANAQLTAILRRLGRR